MKKMKDRKTAYLFNGIFLCVLITGAFFLPMLLLEIQDKQLTGAVNYTFRSGLDYTVAYPEYETNLQNRLSDFAAGLAGGKNYYVSSDYRGKENIDEVFYELINLFQMSGYWPEGELIAYEKGLYEILEQEYYVIYDDELTNGVAFICKYIRLNVNDQYTLNILADEKDNTIYYIEVNQDIEIIKNEKYSTQIMNAGNYFFLYEVLYAYYQSDDLKYERVNTEEAVDASWKLIGRQSIEYDDVMLTIAVEEEYKDNAVGIRMGIEEIMELISSARM